MKNLVDNIIRKFSKKPRTQQELIDFLLDEHTLSAAARGSMEKRNALIDRVNLKQSHS